MDVLGHGVERREVAGVGNGWSHDPGDNGRNLDHGRLHSSTREGLEIQVDRRSILGDGADVHDRRALVADLRNLDRFAARDSGQCSDPSSPAWHRLTQNQIRVARASPKRGQLLSC